MGRAAAVVVFVFAWLVALPGAGFAGAPLDLGDARPRWISVRFENSPADHPDRLAASYTDPIDAWLEPDADPGRLRVTVAGAAVERSYFHRQRIRAGSFSDFVWIFDRASGEVISASLAGTLIRRFDLGPIESEVDTRFEAQMSTQATSGYRKPHALLGQLVFPHCEEAGDACTLIAPVRLDPRTGYVNAVGSIVGRAFGASARTFSSLGEALFNERGSAGEHAPEVGVQEASGRIESLAKR